METDIEKRKIQVLKRVEIFSDLSEEELFELANVCIECNFKKNDIIFREEDRPEFVYIIDEGRIKSYCHCLSGQMIIANISKDIIGLQNMVSGDPLWESAEAMDYVRAMKVSHENFLAFIKNRPFLLIKIINRAENAMSKLFNRVNDLVAESADQRVIDVLYGLHEKFASAFPFRVAEVANLAGLTRETTIRVLSRLNKDKIVKSSRNGITIIDGATLRELKHRAPII
jgi:CRP-like cAMP-binding protein